MHCLKTSNVPQSALVASAMILIQHTDHMNSKATATRQRLLSVLGDKLEDSITKFGAILALGILNAGSQH